MRHHLLINRIKNRSENYHRYLSSPEAKVLSLTNRINQIGGMVELAESLPQPIHQHLLKALKAHLQALATLRCQLQQQHSG